MKRVIYTDQLDAIRVSEDTSHFVPRHLKLHLKTCCGETVYRFMYAFLDATPAERDFVLMLTAPEISSKNTTLSCRDYFRKQAIIRTKFIPADTPGCCRETIQEFLDDFRGCTYGERELIVHVIKRGKLIDFKLCCRRTAGLWLRKIIARTPNLAFLQDMIRHQDEGKFSNEPVSDSNDTVYERGETGDEDDYDFFNS